MSKEKRVQDTIFIDMKYVILYRKLGFKETQPDFFVHNYGDAVLINIEVENQKFLFKNKWYPLLTYKDMVLLELIDRLLKQGYKTENIQIGDKYDLSIVEANENLFVGILLDGWGKPYQKLISEYSHNNNETIALYTSQLSGGLIDFKSKIYSCGKIYEKGLFEKEVKPFIPQYSNPANTRHYDKSRFVVEDNELVKYIGNEETVVVSDGIRRIGTGAFWNNLTIRKIELPNSLTCIAGDAFVYCDNLRKVTIPHSVDEIGDNPFAGCPDIEIGCLSDNFVLEKGVLFNQDKTVVIHYTPSISDKYYIIPRTVEWIGKHSFYKCQNLEEITITKNVAFMGNNAFSDCFNIHLINQSSHFKYINGVLYNRELTQLYHYSMGSGVTDVVIEKGVRTIGRNSFWNAQKIEKITIPETVRQIGYNPFAYCLKTEFINRSPLYTLIEGVLYSSDLQELVCCTSKVAEKEIHLPPELLSIGRNAFTGCESLKGIKLNNNLKFIARGAFSGCINLEKITIPQSVESVGDWAFNNCTNLQEIILPEHIKIEPNLLKNCPAKITRY